MDGSVLPDVADLVAPLVAAVIAQAAPGPAPAPAALANDGEVLGQALRQFQGLAAAVTSMETLDATLTNSVLAAVDPNDPVYGNNLLGIQGIVRAGADAALPAVVDAWYSRRNRPPDDIVGVFSSIQTLVAYERQDDYEALGRRYLALHQPSAAFKAVLSAGEKASLAAALSEVGAVQRALKGASLVPLAGGIRPDWSTGPSVETEPSELDTEKTALVVTKSIGPTITNIRTALHAIANMTAPGVLDRLPRPRFFVTKTSAADDNIRASTDGGSVNINIGQDDPVTTISHEIGHVFENFLPLGCWLDLMRLLQARHTAAGGGNLIAIYPGDSDPEVANEAAFRAQMPAFALFRPRSASYPAKVYPGNCATEVLATTVQMLVEPDAARTLLGNDPQVAAIVLRWLLGPASIQTGGASYLLSLALPSPLPA